MRGSFVFPLMAAALAFAPIAAAEIFPRAADPAGAVIARKSGEQVAFVDLAGWRDIDIDQDLLPGDVLRTNAIGHLAILFSDHTQLRLGRNTTLLVKAIGDAADTLLGLESGTIWGRAEKGGDGVVIETPAAAAAIRGTDWSLSVTGNNETALAVFEGTIELSNPQGSVTVNQGEGAFAAIGQAPRKYILVNIEERHQMLLYAELRGIFDALSPTGLTGPAARTEHKRLLAIPEERRRPVDWIALAETSLDLEGQAAARKALARVPGPLSPPLRARATLVEALLAAAEKDFEGAVTLFAAAGPSLPRDRRAAAAFGEWVASVLANPQRPLAPPADDAFPDDPAAGLARASIAAYALGPAEAIDILRDLERRFPHEARLPALRADLALQLDRRAELEDALKRAAGIDPDEPSYLLAKARFRAAVKGDLSGALVDLRRAVAVAPGDDAAWNEIGNVLRDRNALHESDEAYRMAIKLNPHNPVLHANYARFLTENDQLAAAREAIAAAEAIDSNSQAVLAAKGRYLLRVGRTAEGEEALLQSSAMNPTYGDGLIGLAIASYQQNASEETDQSLTNANRFDPSDPSSALIRSGVAIDRYRADDAIVHAREALRRAIARNVDTEGYDPNRQVSSFLGLALENIELDEWGQFHASKAQDPFRATTYLDEADAGRISPFVGFPPFPAADDRTQSGTSGRASQIQGLMHDALSVANATRRTSLERRAFNELSIGGGPIWEEGEWGWRLDAVAQGTLYTPLPVSYYVGGGIGRPESPRPNDQNDFDGGFFFLGARPSLYDNVLLFGSFDRFSTGFPGQLSRPTLFDQVRTRSGEIGAAWSHILADRNMVQAFVLGRQERRRELSDDVAVSFLDGLGFTGPYSIDAITDGWKLAAGAAHLLGIGPVTLKYGVEGTWSQTEVDTVYIDSNGIPFADVGRSNPSSARAYADAIWDVSPSLMVQAALHAGWQQDFVGGGIEIDPRIGVAWAPARNHWLRLFYREDLQQPTNMTLAPISTVGLRPLELPLFIGGETKTVGAQWDAEWSERLFTRLEFQHQDLDGLSLGIPELSGTFESISGQINRVAASANFWVGGGMGAFATAVWNDSEDYTFNDGVRLPLVPTYQVSAGLSFVHPSRIKATITQTMIGPRESGLVFDLAPYTMTDLAASWKSPSGHLELGVQVQNLFDTDFELAPDIPGPGRTILATVRATF